MNHSTCAFIGQRPSQFPWGYDEEATDCILLKLALYNQLEHFIQNGVDEFITGLTLGADLWCAELVLALKKRYPHCKLTCALASETQASRWSPIDRERYYQVLEQCDLAFFLYHHHSSHCIPICKRFRIDRSDFLLAVYDGKANGSIHHMIEYAKLTKKNMVQIHPATRKKEFHISGAYCKDQPSTFS